MIQSDRAIELLRAIGHPQRLAILNTLASGERGVGDLATVTGIGQPALSQQLAVLRSAGLIEGRREAKQVFYSLNNPVIMQARSVLDAMLPHQTVSQGGGSPMVRSDNYGKVGAAMFARIHRS